MVNKEILPSVLLITSTLLALIVANTPLVSYYNLLIEIPFSISLGGYELSI